MSSRRASAPTATGRIEIEFLPGPATVRFSCNVHQNLGARIDVKNPPSILALSLSGTDLHLSVTNLLGTQTSVLVADDLAAPVWTTGAVFTASGPATNVTMAADGLGPRRFLRLGAVHP
jgi:hypothetical protein